MTTTSICIPRVFQNITSNQITQVFEGLGLGSVERIDLVPFVNSKGEHLNRAFVYIQWNDSEAARNLHEKIHDPEQTAKIVYQEPWFWMLLPNKNPMTNREVAMERRVESLENKLSDLTQAYNYHQFLLGKQDKILRALSNAVQSHLFAPTKESESKNVELDWFKAFGLGGSSAYL